MRYRELRRGAMCDAGIDEVRGTYVLRIRTHASGTSAYYELTGDEFQLFDQDPNAFSSTLLRRFAAGRPLCSVDLEGQDLSQLCRLHEQELTDDGAVLVYGTTPHQSRVLRTDRGHYVCLEINEAELPYLILGRDEESRLPKKLLMRMLGPRHQSRREIHPTVPSLLDNLVRQNAHKFHMIERAMPRRAS